MSIKKPALQILLPVHNEVNSIESVVTEIYDEISPKVAMEFIVSEDGSTDGTQDILRKLSKKFPMILINGKKRKGYAKAVTDGMRRFNSDYLLCLDSDGQCDPKDFWIFWKRRDKADLIIGNRIKRRDNFARKNLSRGFYYLYKLLFSVPIHDPSCPFILTRQTVIRKLLPQLGLANQGFWWEFVARTFQNGFSILEIPIHHRRRLAGVTQAIPTSKMFEIGVKHTVMLFKIRFQSR